MPTTTSTTSTPNLLFQDKLARTVMGLNSLLSDPLLVFKYKCFTESYAVMYEKQIQHVDTIEIGGRTQYRLHEEVALAIWSGARDLRAYILESANNYTIHDQPMLSLLNIK